MVSPRYSFEFDRDYANLAQVFHLCPAYKARLEELEAAGADSYNDSFRGHLGVVATPKDEDTAIYLCQTLATLQADQPDEWSMR